MNIREFVTEVRRNERAARLADGDSMRLGETYWRLLVVNGAAGGRVEPLRAGVVRAWPDFLHGVREPAKTWRRVADKLREVARTLLFGEARDMYVECAHCGDRFATEELAEVDVRSHCPHTSVSVVVDHVVRAPRPFSIFTTPYEDL